ncbi:hypothetical protein AB0399_26715 [Streptomyces sp. NPDC088194]|uniref:hypothetical protein n=1 Tax=Streptomyces sp. NPDC088194 TaxID=3154931 RepID=UPI00344FD8FE
MAVPVPGGHRDGRRSERGRLTALGKSLIPPARAALASWAVEHHEEIETSRSEYGNRPR